MKITYAPQTGRFLAEAKFHEKDILKASGFYWDPEKKLWWTKSKDSALKLRRFFDATAVAETAIVEKKKAETFSTSAAMVPLNDFRAPSPKGMNFFPYQHAGIQFALGRTNTLLADEMGTGKSGQSCGVINCSPDARRILIICPASLKLNWMKELGMWLTDPAKITALYSNGRHRFAGGMEADREIFIVNYDIVEKFDLKSNTWDLLIIDECFPAGTKIKTPHGLKNIEDLKIGDTVCNAVGTGTITATGKQYAKVITLKTDSGEIPVTPHHPFLTDTGWDFAKDLTGKTLKTQGDCLRVLRGDVSKQTVADQVLREVLLCEVEDGATGDFGKITLTGSPVQDRGEASLYQETGRCYGTSGIQTNDAQKPNEKPGDEGEGFGRSGWKGTVSSQGQRVGANGAGEADHGFVTGLGMESPRQDECEKGECGELPDMLQGGLGGCNEEAGRGSKRGESLTIDQEGTGSKEDFEAGGVRVEGIINHEQAGEGDDSGRVAVYNLSVSGHPSYILVIGGKEVVVHNCHYLKNGKSKRRREIWGGREQKPGQPAKTWKAIPAKRTIALTGTPVCNRPSELWTILRALDPETWRSDMWQRFHVRYCAAVKTRHGWDASGADNLDELNKILRSTIMIRRMKTEVLHELPPKTRKTTLLEANKEMGILLSKEAALQAIHEAGGIKNAKPEDVALVGDWLEVGEEGKLPTVVGTLAKIRRMVGEIKAPDAAKYAKQLMEDGLESLVIFAHHKGVVKILEEQLKEYGVVKIVGETSPDDRQKAVDGFQAGKARIFIGSITAAGVGITLTRATHTLFAEVDWVPGNLQQAEDRTHRHGQRGNVVIEYLIYEGSIDTVMVGAVAGKREVIDEITK